MAKIEELKIGTRVQYRDAQGSCTDGVIVGRRVHGSAEGDIDPGIYPNPSADRIKVAFFTIGLPPETISLTCSPNAVELGAETENPPRVLASYQKRD